MLNASVCLLLKPQDTIFNHSGFYMTDKGESQNSHFRWEHLFSRLSNLFPIKVTVKLMTSKGNPQINVGFA
jgi:hypothetical protein